MIMQFISICKLVPIFLIIIYKFHNSKMSISTSKQRDSRKAKTSILFQIKQNNSTQQNIEVAQSINIISLNTPAKHNKINGSQNSNNKNQNNLSNNNNVGNSNGRNQAKRAHQSGKLTIKVASGGNIIDEDGNKVMSLHNAGTLKKIQINDVVQKFVKRHLIVLDKNKVHSDVQSFTNICNQFLQKIDILQQQNGQLNGKVKKFQNYFKQLKTKEGYQQLEFLMQPNTSKNDKNAQLKILNLERKVQTLNYIIKNYRSNNKQQLKQFEKKVNDYKPSLQEQLTKMLGQANQKNQQLGKLIEYFQRQCEKYYKDGNWVEIVRNLKLKDEDIQKLSNIIKQLQKQNNKLKQQLQKFPQIKTQLQTLETHLVQQKAQSRQLHKLTETLSAQLIQKQSQLDQLSRTQQQLLFKLQALSPLQHKIKQKQEQIRKNAQVINRIQSENTGLKNKIGVLVKNCHSQLFNKEAGPIHTIEKCSTTIEELASRFWEEIQALPGVNKEITSFIMHLYEKTKDSFEKIVQQYRQQLTESFLQNKQLTNRLNSILMSNKQKQAYLNQLQTELQGIGQKRVRCRQSQQKIQSNLSCPSCVNWILHWGQLNALYDQLQVVVGEVRGDE